jgi:hypothetical protein
VLRCGMGWGRGRGRQGDGEGRGTGRAGGVWGVHVRRGSGAAALKLHPAGSRVQHPPRAHISEAFFGGSTAASNC